MKVMMIISALLIVANAQAASKCDLHLTLNQSWGYMSEKQEAKTIKLVQERGYTITKDPTAPFTAEITRYFGFECGTGLSRWDEMFNVPAGYEINFKGPGIDIQKEDWYEGVGTVVDKKSFNKLKNEIENLPVCKI
jgi:hypothetical protein